MTVRPLPPAAVTLSIRRLSLDPGQAVPRLEEAVAAALAQEFAGTPPTRRGPTVVEAIAQAIARHPAFAAAASPSSGEGGQGA
jgi:hypothetical protein